MKAPIFLISAALLAGCAPQKPLILDMPGQTQEGYDKDKRECAYDVEKSTQIADPSMRSIFGQELDRALRQRKLMISCMTARGYTVRP